MNKKMIQKGLFVFLVVSIVVIGFLALSGSGKLNPDEMATEIEADFDGKATVQYDEEKDVYELAAENDKMKVDVYQLLTFQVNREEWETIVDKLMKKSRLIEDKTGNNSGLVFLSPIDENLKIFHVKNGDVLYNVVNDF